jgi:hypothetical protein
MDEPVGQLGRYVVLARVGSGFATVYRARDRNLDREVALKMMRPLLLSDPNFVARFQQEARVAANLNHPNIVPIYDYGEIEGRLCLVMRLLPGGSLGDRIVHGPLPWAEVAIVVENGRSAHSTRPGRRTQVTGRVPPARPYKLPLRHGSFRRTL